MIDEGVPGNMSKQQQCALELSCIDVTGRGVKEKNNTHSLVHALIIFIVAVMGYICDSQLGQSKVTCSPAEITQFTMPNLLMFLSPVMGLTWSKRESKIIQ